MYKVPESSSTSGALCKLSGSLTALVTPFNNDIVDERALALLCERQLARGTRALVVCGTTGEAPALLPAEFAHVVALAVEVASRRVPVIAGCGAPATELASMLASIAARSGADALLVSVPPYVKPTQDGITTHVRVISHASDRPVMLYDVPSRCSVAVSDITVARLFERGLIWALKDATGDLGRPPRLRALCGEGLLQFSGDDATAAAHRAMGGHGCISVTANIVPALCARLHECWEKQNRSLFETTRDLLAPLNDALFAESNPIPVKAALATLDLCGPQIRLPLTSATAATRGRLDSLLAGLMPLEDKAEPRVRLSLVG